MLGSESAPIIGPGKQAPWHHYSQRLVTPDDAFKYGFSVTHAMLLLSTNLAQHSVDLPSNLKILFLHSPSDCDIGGEEYICTSIWLFKVSFTPKFMPSIRMRFDASLSMYDVPSENNSKGSVGASRLPYAAMTDGGA